MRSTRPLWSRRRSAGLLAAVLAGALVVALPQVAAAGTRAPGDPAPLNTITPVSGTSVAVKALPPEPDADRALRGAPKVAWPVAGAADVSFSPAQLQAKQAAPAGNLPVRLSPSTSDFSTSATQSAKVRAEVLDQEVANAAGTPGILLRLSRTDGVQKAAPVTADLDYSGFRNAFGGDWAARLRVVAMPACAATTPDRAECRTKKPLATHNDIKAGRVSAPVSAEPGGSVFALDAAASGPTGDYTATPLAPAAAWSVGTQSGTFTWNYPLSVPQVPGGLVPSLAMSYSSGGIDGRVASTNNQASWIGDGWNLGAGAISWQFKACADDGVVPKTGDMCWAGNYATMAFAGHSGELVYDDDAHTWRPKSDDGTRVEYLSGADNGDRDGNYWRVTTTDGTQYYFGSRAESKATWTVPVFGNNDNEPCHAGDYAGSSCDQAWTWNLDYVVDRHQNTVKYFYDQERNSYGINLGQRKADYTRAGTLRRIEYGANEKISGAAPAVVDFEIADRCVEGKDCSQHTKESYVDVPWEQQCDAATCDKLAPAFFSSKRLAKVTTKLLDKPVDSWTLFQTYPDPGDNTSASLWFKSITHTGLANGGSVAEPPVVFNGFLAPNRVNTAQDGLPPMNKFRIGGVRNEIGGHVQVNWAPVDCTATSLPTPETNKQRCFPVRWAYEQAQPRDDWFQKYVVGQVLLIDRVGGGLGDLTGYEYLDGAAWHYTENPLVPAERQNWSDWRGYGRVVERHGDPATDPGVKVTKKEQRYFRGMNGDRLNRDGGTKPPVVVEDSQGGRTEDSDGLAGFLREEVTFNGDTPAQVGGTITDPFRKQTAKQGSHIAYIVRAGTVRGRTTLASGGVRRTETASTYNDEGIVTETNDRGDIDDPRDDQCKTVTYARDTDKRILTLPSQETVVGVACGTTAVFPQDSISDSRTYYDNGALGSAPTTGATTRTEVVSDYPGGNPLYVNDSVATFDDYGRGLTTTDALNRVSKVGYEPATGPPAKSTKTDPAGNVTTTFLNQTLGKPQRTVDVNGRRTDVAYDPLGRVTEVWKPGRDKDKADSGHVIYDYNVRNDAISSVATRTLKANSNYTTAYALYDGLGRARQTQSSAWMMPGQTARIVADTIYDSRGLAVKSNDGYLATGSAGTDLFASKAGDADVPSQTVTEYDGAARPTASVFRSANVEQWRSTVEYRGDSIAQTPPKGGTATTTKVDVRGRATQLSQHLAANPVGTADTTTYSYTKAGKPESVTDAAGNVWTYGYDARGRTISAKDPDKGESTMTYDNAGQLKTKKDARPQTVAYKYDLLGRKTETHADTAEGPLLAQWTYDTVPDANGPLKGLPASSTRYVNGNAYKTEITGYDIAYRPTSTVLTVPASETGLAGTYTSTAAYNVDGSKHSETLPKLGTNLAEESILYGYDDYGMPSTMTGNETYVGYTRYTPFGEREMVRLGVTGAESWERRGYELASHRLSRTVVEHAKTTDLQSDVTYGYDPGGNAKSLSTKVPGTKDDLQCFGNDYLGRITEAWTSTANCAGAPGSSLGGPSTYWSTFGYDQVGNRKSDTTHGMGGAADVVRKSDYPAAGAPRPHAPTTVTTTGPAPKVDTYGYSPTGGTTGRPAPAGGNQVLTWDAEDKVVSATAGTAVTTYAYDAEGSRLTTRDAKGATLTLPDGSEIRYDAAAKTVTGNRFYRYGDSTVAVRKTGQLTGVDWMFQDRSGSDTVSVNASSFQVNRRLLDPFGQLRQAQPAGWPSSRGFAGGSADSATGLTHLGARDYDTKTGKFLSVDPILSLGSPQQFNAYAYADNNPATKSDPTGLIAQSCPDGECPNGHGSFGGIAGKNPNTNDPPGGAKSVFDIPPGAAMPRACQGQTGLSSPGSISAWCAGVAQSKMPACDGSFTSLLKFECGRQRAEIAAVAAATETERARLQKIAEDKEHPGLTLDCVNVSVRGYYAAAGYQRCTTPSEPGVALHIVKGGAGLGEGASMSNTKMFVPHAKSLDEIAGWGWSMDADAAVGPFGGSVGTGGHFDAKEPHQHMEVGYSGLFMAAGAEAGASLNIERSWITR